MARFGEILAELRQDRGLTQETLARVLFVTAGTISNYENSAHFPDIEKLTALADFFDVPLDYLLGRCASSLPPGTLDEPLVPGVPSKSAGRVIAEIRALPSERQRAPAAGPARHDAGDGGGAGTESFSRKYRRFTRRCLPLEALAAPERRPIGESGSSLPPGHRAGFDRPGFFIPPCRARGRTPPARAGRKGAARPAARQGRPGSSRAADGAGVRAPHRGT